jgi:hypothetical protein
VYRLPYFALVHSLIHPSLLPSCSLPSYLHCPSLPFLTLTYVPLPILPLPYPLLSFLLSLLLSLQLREKMKEITELRYDSDRKDEEIERLRKEDSSLGGSLEIERRSRQKQLAELHARDGELMLMR